MIGGASQAVDGSHRDLSKGRVQRSAVAGQPCVPHVDCGAGQRAAAAGTRAPASGIAARADGGEPERRVLSDGPGVVPQMLDILARQVASPVQFVKGLSTLYDAGARIFVEVGPEEGAAGIRRGRAGRPRGRGRAVHQSSEGRRHRGLQPGAVRPVCGGTGTRGCVEAAPCSASDRMRWRQRRSDAGSDRYLALGHMFAEVWIARRNLPRPGAAAGLPVTITGASLGLPGTDRIFDDANVARILRGDQFIDVIPTRFRRAMLDKNITRLMKSDNGGPTFESIHDVADVIKLAARGGAFDLEKEFGVSADRVAALDRVTALAIGAGIDALRDAGIPLVLRYKTTSKGTQLPDRWVLPEALRDDTGVIFASVFPGFDSFADELSRHYADRERRKQLAMLEDLRGRVVETNGHSTLGAGDRPRTWRSCATALEKEPYTFDRRFLFRVLSMGHSQFAEFIGARGPNTQINSACASTTQAVAVAEDWIHAGRCRRVIVVSADDITSDHLIDWFGAGFLASGAAATDAVVEDAAIPFDRRRHGMIMGMGAAAMVVESAQAASERGIRPICEVLGAVTANSAFHGTRLDVEHISRVMESLVAKAESRSGISRAADCAAHGFHFPRDVHARARRQRGGGDPRAALRIRRRRGPDRDRQHQGAHGPRDGDRHRRRGGGEGAGDGMRAAGGQLQGSRSRAGAVEPVEGRRLSGGVRAAAGRGIRLADQHDAVALGADQRWGAPQPECAGLPVSHCRYGAPGTPG